MRLFLVFLLLSFKIYSQSGLIKTYHPLINKAELAVCNNDLKLTDMLYKEAFTILKNPLAKDLYNAAACKLLLGDVEASKQYFLKLAKKGIPWEYLDFNNLMKDNSKSLAGFKNTYEMVLESTKPKSKSLVYNNLQEKLDSLYLRKDREYNYTYVGGFIEGNKVPMMRLDYNNYPDSINLQAFIVKQKLISEDSVKKANKIVSDFENLQKELFNAEILKIGFPTEEEVLITHDHNKEYMAMAMKRNTINTNRFIDHLILLFGNYYHPNNVYNQHENILDIPVEQLIKAVDTGKMNPEIAWLFSKNDSLDYKFSLNLMQFNIENIEECDKVSKNKYFKNYIVKDILTLEEEKKYNNLALQFGVPCFQDTQNKTLFKLTKNQYFLFQTNGHLEVQTVASCDSADLILKYSNYTEYNPNE